MGLYVGGTATANHLDDYEEGTCTLSLQLGGVTHGDYGARTGRYTKVGDVCHIQISLYVTNIGGGIYRAGAADCSGLPFTAITASYGEAAFIAGNHNNASVPVIFGAVHGGGSKMRFRRGGSLEFDGNKDHNQGGVGATFWIHGTLTYKTV